MFFFEGSPASAPSSPLGASAPSSPLGASRQDSALASFVADSDDTSASNQFQNYPDGQLPDSFIPHPGLEILIRGDPSSPTSEPARMELTQKLCTAIVRHRQYQTFPRLVEAVLPGINVPLTTVSLVDELRDQGRLFVLHPRLARRWAAALRHSKPDTLRLAVEMLTK